MSAPSLRRLCPLTSCLGSNPLITSGLSKLRQVSTDLHAKLCLAGDMIGLIGSSATIAKASSHLQSGLTFDRLSSLESACGTGMGINNLLDTGALFTQCLTGTMFYEVNGSGNFVVKTCVTQNEDGTTTISHKRVLRSPLEISSKVTRLASKAIGSVCFADSEFKIGKLGKHAKGLGGVGSSLSILSSVCGMADDAVNIASAVRTKDATTAEAIATCRKTIREKVLSLICNFFDAVAEVVGLFGTFAPALLGPHALLIVGIFWLLSSAANFIQDFIG
ncbi:hypothetical protein [Chlamydia vaughanii]|uniref:hypothetical protein n=1 Tax=Chlamydia vaughanii TaxID=3112552 RepID=UPI0032B2286D